MKPALEPPVVQLLEKGQFGQCLAATVAPEIHTGRLRHARDVGRRHDEAIRLDGAVDLRAITAHQNQNRVVSQNMRHGGGDLLLLEDLFGDGEKNDPLGRAASHLDGARSILTGIAANQSFATGQPVQLDQLLKLGE